VHYALFSFSSTTGGREAEGDNENAKEEEHVMFSIVLYNVLLYNNK
jgi:hypothetical protein